MVLHNLRIVRFQVEDRQYVHKLQSEDMLMGMSHAERSDGKPLSMHTDGRSMEEKRKSLYVSAETLKLRVHVESWPGLKKTLCDRSLVWM